MAESTRRARVVGYARVSTEGQAEEGVSLAAQREKLEMYARLHDLEMVALFTDAGVSAKSLDRPGLHAALAALKDGTATGLVVAKLDRLTRSVRDLGSLVEDYFGEEFSLFSIADNIDTRSAGGRLVLNVLVSVAQWEREAVSERTSEALRHLKAKGVRIGREGMGWRRCEERDAEDRRLVEQASDELRTVERIRDLRRQGLSLRAICSTLQLEGHRTKRGGAWGPQTVAAILKRAA